MEQKKEKKALDNPFLGGMVVPLAVVLVGALLIFGVSKLLTPERNHIELVRELKAKTFGNRWIAAYELSKLIATSKIPESEQAELIEDLTELYDSSRDPRTKKFLVMAVNALKDPKKLELISKATQDPDRDIKFHAIVALANSDKSLSPDLTPLKKIVENPTAQDPGMLQASILGLAHHVTPEADSMIRKLLGHSNFKVQMAAASGLINYKDEAAVEKVSQILLSGPEYFQNYGVTKDEAAAVKVNMIETIGKMNWTRLKNTIEKVRQNTDDIKVAGKAAEILEKFKN